MHVVPEVARIAGEGGPVRGTGPFLRLRSLRRAFGLLAAATCLLAAEAAPAKVLWRAGSVPPGSLPSGDTPARRSIAIDPQGLVDLASFTLHLPDSSTIDVGRVRTERPVPGSIVWHGRLPSDPSSRVTLSQFGNRVTGSIRLGPGRFFRVRSDSTGAHLIEEFDPSSHPDGNDPIVPALPLGPADAAPPCGTDGSRRIDVLVLYSDDAGRQEGGPDAMTAKIHLAVAETNQSYRNSRIDQSIHVVHIGEVQYAETGDVTDAYLGISGGTTPALAAARDLRETWGADIVAFVVELDTSSCGQSAILDALSTSQEYRAFAAITRRCMTAPDYSFAHELGHVMGAKHDWTDDPSSAVVPYAHGFVQPAPPATTPRPWRTIMGHKDTCEERTPPVFCERIPSWSNPSVQHYTEDTGVAGGAEPADNARALNETAPYVANFRCHVPQWKDPWMPDTWADTGQENPVDPALDGEPMWKSPAIWVRNNVDPDRRHAHQHQNPIAGRDNYAYVKIYGGMASMSGALDLYSAHAGTGLVWDDDWTLVLSVDLAGLGVQETRIVEFPWAPTESGHYCLVARWRSPSDPLPGPEFEDIHRTVRAYNNFAWRNVNIVELVSSSTMAAEVSVENASKGSEEYSLSFAPAQAPGDGDYFEVGDVEIELDSRLRRRWLEGGARGSGFALRKGRIVVTDPAGARLDGIRLTGKARAAARLHFSRRTTLKLRNRAYEFDFVQRLGRGPKSRVVGGVSYVVVTGALKP